MAIALTGSSIACSQDGTAENDEAVATSDLTTVTRAPEALDLVEGAGGTLLVHRGNEISEMNPVTGALTSVLVRGGSMGGALFAAKDGVSFRILGDRQVVRRAADGSELSVFRSGDYDVRFTGFDDEHFYFETLGSGGYGTRYYRVPFTSATRAEGLGEASSADSYARVTTIADGRVFWSIKRRLSDEHPVVGFTGQRGVASTVVAAGAYLHPRAFATYQGDLYALAGAGEEVGIFKSLGADVTKFEKVCSIPATWHAHTDDGLTTVPVGQRSLFVVDAKGFYFPIKETEKIPRVPFDGTAAKSAVARVGWDCTAENLTGFGPAVELGWGFPQITRIAVRGERVFWTYRMRGHGNEPFAVNQAVP